VKKAVGESPFKGCSPRHAVMLTDAAGGGFVHPQRRAAGREAEEDRGREGVTVPVAVDFCAELPRPYCQS
jgi:hypothetical protein